jgi:hypothetical protein
MDYKSLLKIVHSVLKERGFRRRSNNWYCYFNETIAVFNMQRSSFSAYYFLNIGVNINEIDREDKFPKEYQSHFKVRLDNYCFDDVDYFDLKNSILDDDREKGVRLFLKEIVIKLIEQLSTVSGIKEYCRDNPQMISRQNIATKQYLGLVDEG